VSRERSAEAVYQTFFDASLKRFDAFTRYNSQEAARDQLISAIVEVDVVDEHRLFGHFRRGHWHDREVFIEQRREVVEFQAAWAQAATALAVSGELTP